MNSDFESQISELQDKIRKQDIQDEETIDYFDGKLKKAVQLMKVLYDFDEDVSDDEFYKVVEKVRSLVEKAELNIELKKKAIEREELEMYRFKSAMSGNSYDMWFYYVREFVLKEKGEERF